MDKETLQYLFWVFCVLLICIGGGFVLGVFGETSIVIQNEFGAKASLEKYEWFVDAHETLNEKRSTIKVHESKLSDLADSYKGVPRRDWDRLDKQQYNLWSSEIAGITASYNLIVKEYNAQSKKFNWNLYNTTLPKKVDTYINK